MSFYERYDCVDTSSSSITFEFISTGPKGDIKKVIQFTSATAKGIYNLSLGNIREDGSVDDFVTNDNKDRNKILATVASVVQNFTKRFPDCYIFFAGSTKGRNRLYRMAITLNYKELTEIFVIWGLPEDGNFEIFEKNGSYSGFLIKRK